MILDRYTTWSWDNIQLCTACGCLVDPEIHRAACPATVTAAIALQDAITDMKLAARKAPWVKACNASLDTSPSGSPILAVHLYDHADKRYVACMDLGDGGPSKEMLAHIRRTFDEMLVRGPE